MPPRAANLLGVLVGAILMLIQYAKQQETDGALDWSGMDFVYTHTHLTQSSVEWTQLKHVDIYLHPCIAFLRSVK